MGTSSSVSVPIDPAPAAATPAPAPAPAPATPPKEGDPRPTWLPEKFESPEKLASAYQELERKLSATPAAPEAAPAADPLAPFTAEYAAKGALTEESYAKLATMGMPKGLVDTYIEGVKAKAATEVANIHAVVGGKDQFDTMAAWAGTNMPAEQANSLNAMFVAGGESARLAAMALAQAYGAANPSLLTATGVSTGTAGYESYAQFQDDLRDPKYQTNSEFRARVEAKLRASDHLFQ